MSGSEDVDDRVRELRSTGLLDGPREEPFDRITRLAQRLVGVESAAISLVDVDRQFFLSAVGLSREDEVARETSLAYSFCKFTVASGDRFVVEDATRSALVRDNLAVSERGLASYAGEPLALASGNVLGTLCVFNSQPHDWSSTELTLLEDLAALTVSEIELRLANKAVRELAVRAARLRDPVDQLGDAVRSTASLTETPDDPRLARMAGVAESRMTMVEVIVHDLSCAASERLARSRSPTCVPDVAEPVRRAVRNVNGSVAREVVHVTVPDVALPVAGDAHEIERTLVHVLLASLHHLEDGSAVSVDVAPAGRFARVQVHSSGRAMPVRDLLRLVSRSGSRRHGAPSAGTFDDEASISSRGGTTFVRSGAIAATTGGTGTTFRLDLEIDPISDR